MASALACLPLALPTLPARAWALVVAAVASSEPSTTSLAFTTAFCGSWPSSTAFSIAFCMPVACIVAFSDDATAALALLIVYIGLPGILTRLQCQPRVLRQHQLPSPQVSR